MPKTQTMQEPEDHARSAVRDEDGLLESVVRDNFLAALGEPAGLHCVRVRRVFGDSYRVNVYTGQGVASLTIARSHFLTADGDGKILECCPPLVKAE